MIAYSFFCDKCGEGFILKPEDLRFILVVKCPRCKSLVIDEGVLIG